MGSAPLSLVMPPPLGTQRWNEGKEWPLLERVGKGLQWGPPAHFPFSAKLQGSLGSWAITFLRLPGKFLLEPPCAFVLSWLFLRCLEPWLLMLMVCPCSLFIPFSVTDVQATQNLCMFGGLGWHHSLFLLTTLRNRIFFLFASWHRMGASNQSLFRVGVLQIFPWCYPRLKLSAFRIWSFKCLASFLKLPNPPRLFPWKFSS